MRGKHIALWTAIGIGVGAALGSATGEMGVWVNFPCGRKQGAVAFGK